MGSLLSSIARLFASGASQWYPDASRVQDFSGVYREKMDLSASARGVLHTTEGSSWPSYSGGSSAPHFTVRPDFVHRRVEVRQHFPISGMGRALVHSRWPETNRLNCIQIELVGFCDTRKSDSPYFVGNWPDWYYDGIAKLMRWVETNAHVQRSTSVRFLAYPASYGNNGVRLNSLQWQRATGWLGHQHVDQNDHGDPGLVDIQYLLGTKITPPAPKPTPSPSPSPAPPVRVLGALPLAVDGRFGLPTIAALQRATGARVDGIWGPESIKALQRFVGVAADGIIGPNTVKGLQSAAGARVDGLWGTGTTAALQKALNTHTFKVRVVVPGGGPIPTPIGKIAVDGSFGPATIRALQRVLNVREDGAFGPTTRVALQRKLRVTPDGVIGPATVKALQKKVGVVQDGIWGTGTTSALQAALNSGRF